MKPAPKPKPLPRWFAEYNHRRHDLLRRRRAAGLTPRGEAELGRLTAALAAALDAACPPPMDRLDEFERAARKAVAPPAPRPAAAHATPRNNAVADHKRLTEAELDALVAGGPADGTYWRHRRTLVVYAVLTTALRESDCTPQVVYGRGRRAWVRPMAEFLDRFEPMPDAGEPVAGKVPPRPRRQR